MRLVAAGVPLDAEFVLEQVGGELSLVIESKRGSPPRNVDYNRGLELALTRLGQASVVLRDACVDTRRTVRMSREQRRLALGSFEYPLNLALVASEELRKCFNRASASTARSESARGSGNRTRRVRMYLETALSLDELEQVLVRGVRRQVWDHRVVDGEREGMSFGYGPAWAESWGEDRYGAFASFTVGDVEQHMRWIPPGSFMMGDEGKQRRVELSSGFWMAETPCTQALWEAVMGNNPSYFKSPRRPVEQVSWKDAKAFLTRLDGMCPELDASLPTEAQWEYGCRAGTSTATYAGPLEVLGDHNAPVLHEIAWYGGNSGVDWDLDPGDGVNSSGWKDKQFPHARAGTREVGLKRPNAWGLYDTLGNVWEWCEDWHGALGHAPVENPIGPPSGRSRVYRGGSWDVAARSVRAACRYWSEPGYRVIDLGFRLVRGQGLRQPDERSESQHEIETSKGGQARVRDEPGVRPASVQVGVPRRSRSRTLRPPWADGAGRDHFGRWASFQIEGVVQRMRWIEPGSFVMGSPEDEPGRYSDEGPQHQVTLTKGFWMAETPCTQELWETIAGTNPSRFPSSRRPVEQVSWDDVQEFVLELERRRPGLAIRLPTEAQWEYACRAGTTTATYAGPLEILGVKNAPILDDIAWYGGNSGVDFDLGEGYDSSGWDEKQYQHQRAGTREVRLKRPNDWGLYDMLGNVWEWCADYYGDYEAKAVENPVSPPSGRYRVFRGGGWSAATRNVRAASRYWRGPGGRSFYLGFRLVRGQ